MQVPEVSCLFGEIGLSGEIRTVSNVSTRLKEAEKLGFTQAIMPFQNIRGKQTSNYTGKIKITEIKTLQNLVDLFHEGAASKNLAGNLVHVSEDTI